MPEVGYFVRELGKYLDTATLTNLLAIKELVEERIAQKREELKVPPMTEADLVGGSKVLAILTYRARTGTTLEQALAAWRARGKE